MNRIFIELKTGTRGGGLCGSVIVRHNGTLVQTPWLIGQFREAAQQVAKDFADKYPNIPQTRIGF